jgi:uncharacterized protein with HEPN domain
MAGDDRDRLKHMLESAREALGFASGRGKKDLEQDRLLVLGLLKSVEIIGEAASRISPETRRKNPNIPWAEIIATRNRLIHVYFDVDLEQVWKTVTDDLPKLAAELEKIDGSET